MIHIIIVNTIPIEKQLHMPHNYYDHGQLEDFHWVGGDRPTYKCHR